MKEIISKDQICITWKTGVVFTNFSGGSPNRSHDARWILEPKLKKDKNVSYMSRSKQRFSI